MEEQEVVTEKEQKVKRSKKQAARDELDAIQNVGTYGIARKKKKFPIKALIITLSCFAVIAIAAGVLWWMLKSKYTDAIDEQVAILNDREENLEACLDASVGKMKKDFILEYNDFEEAYLGNEGWDDGLISTFQEQYAQMEKSFGSDFKVSYEVKEEKQLTEEELKNYYEDMWDYLTTGIQGARDSENLNADSVERLESLFNKWKEMYRDVKVTDGYSVIVEVTYMSGNTERTVPKRMIVVQIDGEWIVRVGGLLSLDSSTIFESMNY